MVDPGGEYALGRAERIVLGEGDIDVEDSFGVWGGIRTNQAGRPMANVSFSRASYNVLRRIFLELEYLIVNSSFYHQIYNNEQLLFEILILIKEFYLSYGEK
jgi:hypothetical protein